MRDARAEVTGRVDGVAGRATEGGADRDHEDRDGKRAERREAAFALSPPPKPMTTKTSTKVPMISVTRFQP